MGRVKEMWMDGYNTTTNKPPLWYGKTDKYTPRPEIIPYCCAKIAPRNYIKRSEWNKIKLIKKERNPQMICEGCQNEKAVDLHESFEINNGVYKFIGAYLLCKKCHVKVHLGQNKACAYTYSDKKEHLEAFKWTVTLGVKVDYSKLNDYGIDATEAEKKWKKTYNHNYVMLRTLLEIVYSRQHVYDAVKDSIEACDHIGVENHYENKAIRLAVNNFAFFFEACLVLEVDHTEAIMFAMQYHGIKPEAAGRAAIRFFRHESEWFNSYNQTMQLMWLYTCCLETRVPPPPLLDELKKIRKIKEKYKKEISKICNKMPIEKDGDFQKRSKVIAEARDVFRSKIENARMDCVFAVMLHRPPKEYLVD